MVPIIFISSAYLFQLLQRSTFNLFSAIRQQQSKGPKINQIKFDIFIKMDCAFAVLSLAVFLIIYFFGSTTLKSESTRSYPIYLAVISMICSLLKIGIMALVIERFSILILTLGEMLLSTNAIAVIMLIYMMMYIQFGSTEYGDVSDLYPQIMNSTRLSYDSFLASYGWSTFIPQDPI